MSEKYQEERRCACCGKTVYVLHPSRWAYKKKKNSGVVDYYCSWKCLRACEAKEEKKRRQAEEPQEKERHNKAEMLAEMIEAVEAGKDPIEFLQKMGYADPKDTIRRLRIYARENDQAMYKKIEKYGLLDLRKRNKERKEDMSGKISKEQKEKAFQIAIEGGDAVAFLKECGSVSPDKLWWYMKNQLKKTDPELYAKLPKPAIAEKAKKLPVVKRPTVRGMTGEEMDKLAKREEQVRTVVHQDGHGIHIEVRPERALKIKSVFSEVIDGGNYIKAERGEPLSIRTHTIMALVTNHDRMLFSPTECHIELTKEEWLQLIDEIRTALEQLEL